MLQTGTLAFLAGILLLQTRADLPPTWCLYSLPVVILAILVNRNGWFKLAGCLLAGFLWAQFQAHGLLLQRLPASFIHKNLHVQGVIAGLPRRRGERTQFILNIRKLVSPRLAHFPHKVRLSWYADTPPDLRPGQIWNLTLRLRTPHRFMDPGTFDYSAWLLERGITATGYVYTKGDNRLISQSVWRFPVQSLRYRCSHYLQTVLVGSPAAGLIRALLIGDRSGISAAQWDLLRRTGTVHLMAISGLHIGLIAGFVFFIVTWLWRYLPRACLLLPAPKAAAICAWLAACLYAALAGFAIPTQRALIMLAVILLSLLLQRTYKPSQVIAVALFLVLLWDPFAVLSASFWLSFSAVALIYFLAQIQSNDASRVRRWWRMQLSISLGLLPLVIVFFQQASLISPLCNLVAIPFVSVLVLPLALISTVLATFSHSLGGMGLHLAAGLMQLLQSGLSWMAAWKGSLIYLPAPSWYSLSLAMLGIGVLLLPRQVPGRYLGLLLCLPVCLPSPIRPPAGHIRLSLLDVGQGLAAVVQTAHHTLVFDTGPRFSPAFDAGRAVVLPYLRQQGISVIDTLLISHSDRDHIGGAKSLLQAMPVRHILSSVPGMRRDQRDSACFAGRRWQWDGVSFHVLYPSRAEYTAARKNNNRSCVLQITGSARRLLLTADIEYPAETKLVAHYGEKLRSDVLVIPHHGSKTSSSPAFIAAVDPRLALIPAGWHNRFHLPARQVVERLRSRHLPLLNTATDGAIVVETGRELRVRSYRQQYQRYWQAW